MFEARGSKFQRNFDYPLTEERVVKTKNPGKYTWTPTQFLMNIYRFVSGIGGNEGIYIPEEYIPPDAKFKEINLWITESTEECNKNRLLIDCYSKTGEYSLISTAVPRDSTPKRLRKIKTGNINSRSEMLKYLEIINNCLEKYMLSEIPALARFEIDPSRN